MYRLARSGAAKPPPFFAIFYRILAFAMPPPLPFLPRLRDGTDIRVLYILMMVMEGPYTGFESGHFSTINH